MALDFYIPSVATSAANVYNAGHGISHEEYTRADVQRIYELAFRAGYLRASDDLCLALLTLKGE